MTLTDLYANAADSLKSADQEADRMRRALTNVATHRHALSNASEMVSNIEAGLTQRAAGMGSNADARKAELLNLKASDGTYQRAVAEEARLRDLLADAETDAEHAKQRIRILLAAVALDTALINAS